MLLLCYCYVIALLCIVKMIQKENTYQEIKMRKILYNKKIFISVYYILCELKCSKV